MESSTVAAALSADPKPGSRPVRQASHPDDERARKHGATDEAASFHGMMSPEPAAQAGRPAVTGSVTPGDAAAANDHSRMVAKNGPMTALGGGEVSPQAAEPPTIPGISRQSPIAAAPSDALRAVPEGMFVSSAPASDAGHAGVQPKTGQRPEPVPAQAPVATGASSAAQAQAMGPESQFAAAAPSAELPAIRAQAANEAEALQRPPADHAQHQLLAEKAAERATGGVLHAADTRNGGGDKASAAGAGREGQGAATPSPAATGTGAPSPPTASADVATVSEPGEGAKPGGLADPSEPFAAQQDARTDPSTARTEAPRDTARPPILRDAIPQMLHAVRQSAPGEVELMLDPEELGRIRMSLTLSDGGLQVMIQSDRADTGELMRRHAGLLRDELAGLGFAEVDIGFGARADPQRSAPDLDPGHAADAESEIPGVVRAALDLRQTAAGRLDLRL
jgi:hypothetical protein